MSKSKQQVDECGYNDSQKHTVVDMRGNSSYTLMIFVLAIVISQGQERHITTKKSKNLEWLDLGKSFCWNRQVLKIHVIDAYGNAKWEEG